METCVDPDQEWPAVDTRKYPPLPQAPEHLSAFNRVGWALDRERGPQPLHTIVWRSGLDYEDIRTVLRYGYARHLLRTFEYGRFALYERVGRRERPDAAPPAALYKASQARQPNKTQRAKIARTAPTLPLLPEMS